MDLGDYLKFDNAVLFWVSGFLFVMLVNYLVWLVRQNGGWPAVLTYIRDKWLRTRGDGGEITLALGALVLGITVRAGAIGLWRAMGAVPSAFPYLACGVGDVLMIGGMLCAIRVAAVKRPFNWPWVVAAITGAAFGLLSLAFPLGAVESPVVPAYVLGDCGSIPDRALTWLIAPVSLIYDGGVTCSRS